MKYDHLLKFGLALSMLSTPLAAAEEIEVLMSCGASSGFARFLPNAILKESDIPEDWEADGISGGHILLVRTGEKFDILFSDSIGGDGYRSDGSQVVPLGESDGRLNIIAAQNNYADLYTFDFVERRVYWSSHKIGTIFNKVAVYEADCD